MSQPSASFSRLLLPRIFPHHLPEAFLNLEKDMLVELSFCMSKCVNDNNDDGNKFKHYESLIVWDSILWSFSVSVESTRVSDSYWPIWLGLWPFYWPLENYDRLPGQNLPSNIFGGGFIDLVNQLCFSFVTNLSWLTWYN